MQPGRKQTVFIPKYRPYSCTMMSAATLDAPKTECRQASMDMSSRMPS